MPPVLRPAFILTACLAALGAADQDWSLNGPEPLLDGDAVVYLRGFAGRKGDQTLVADAVRYQPGKQLLYATGHVVFRQPEVRITAARIGLDGKRRRGEAWDVTARVEHQGRTLVLQATRLELNQDVFTLHDVVVDMGHGASLSFHAPTVRITLREPPKAAPGAERLGPIPQDRVASIEMVSPTGRVVGVPVLWVPWLYRDFTNDYPWTRFRGGQSNRLGTWGRFWIGTNLPEFAGWRTVAEARVDRHSRAGNGGGLGLRWKHPLIGKGGVDTYAMPRESVRDRDREEVAVRRNRGLVDAEHRTDLGAGAFYGRFVAGPDPRDGLGDPTGNRFISDYLPDSLEQRPFPRRSAAVTYTLKGLTLTADTERVHTPGIDRTERLVGIEGTLTPLQIVGPLHWGGTSWLEALDNPLHDTSAKRFTGRTYLTAGHWLPGGVGLDATGGVKDTSYINGVIQGQEQDSTTSRQALFTDSGVSWRLLGTYGEVTHTLTPRVGFEAVGRGLGDRLPGYGFLDGREAFTEDERYWSTSLDTAVVASRTLFHADVKARWAARLQDRHYQNAQGQDAVGPTALADVTGTADGSPLPDLHLNGSFLWDARPREWLSAELNAQYRVTPWLALDHDTSLRTRDAGTVRTWEHRPTLYLLSGRYVLGTGPTFRPADAAPLDGWRSELVRRVVEGDLFLSGEYVRDENGDLYDRRFVIGFTLGGAENIDDEPRSRIGYTPR